MNQITPLLAVGEALRDGLLGFAGNIFIAVFAVVSVGYLLKREMVQFAGFLVAAILIGTIIYAPDQWTALFESVGKWIS